MCLAKSTNTAWVAKMHIGQVWNSRLNPKSLALHRYYRNEYKDALSFGPHVLVFLV